MSKDRLAQAITQLEQRRDHYRARLHEAEAVYQRAHEEANIGLAEIDQLLAILALKDVTKLTAPPSIGAAPLPRRRASPGAIHDAILGQLANRTFGPMTAADIASATHLKQPSVRAACKKMAAAGEIVETTDGYILLTKEAAAKPAVAHEAAGADEEAGLEVAPTV